MLFDEFDRKDMARRPYAEPQYVYLNRSARPEAARVRACVEEWFARYPEEEKNAFRSAFQSEKDAKFLAAAFELYLHEMLCRLGYKVQVHPENPTGKSTRPDFLAVAPDASRVYVEAVFVTDTTDAERAAESRKSVVYDTLNQMGPTDFFLGMNLQGSPSIQPPAKKLREDLRAWLRSLDVIEVAKATESCSDAELPKLNFEYEGWHIEFFAIPKSEQGRGKVGVSPIGFQSEGVRWMSTRTSIRDAILGKGSKYGAFPDPFLVAVGTKDFHVDRIDVMEALFGQEQDSLSMTSQRTVEQTMERAPNGVWISPKGPRYRRISAVMLVPGIAPWTVAERSGTVYHNPWTTKPCVGPICSLPQYTCAGDGIAQVAGVSPREVFGLPEGWPDVE